MNAAPPVSPCPPESAPLTFDACRRHVPEFVELLQGAVRQYGVPERALLVRTLLQLPRLARPDGSIARSRLTAELNRSAARLRQDQQSIRHLISADRFELSALRFVRLGNSAADQIFSRLHYLRSARAGSLNFALVDPVHHLPVTLCSVTPLEWMRVGRQLEVQFGIPMSAAWDVSRVYSFDVAPVNAISYLLAKVRQTVRRELPTAQVLTTAVDPNLGFVGSSYRAANWQQWMSIQARPYLYAGGRYVTPRQLREWYGGANLAVLRAGNPNGRFEQSRVALEDSLIFCCRVRGETEAVPPADQRRLRR